MISAVAKNIAGYRKGQVFPFVFVIVVVLIIMLMITINLGQVALFQTDVSNAADAGALAGSSMLSSGVMGLGLLNSTISARAAVSFVFAVLEAITIVGIPLAVLTLVAHMVKTFAEYIVNYSNWIAILGQSKKTAMQYAWQNVGVDEPRPSLNTFCQYLYGKDLVDLTSAQRATAQTYYEQGFIPGDKNSDEALSSGFGLFMKEDSEGGDGWWHWKAPKVGFGNMIPGYITSSYGWNMDLGVGKPNCMFLEDCQTAYAGYDNYVQVSVTAPMIFEFKLISFAPSADCLTDYINGLIEQGLSSIGLPQVLIDIISVLMDLVDFVKDLVWGLVDGILGSFFPVSIMFERNETDYFAANPVEVTVKRYKKAQNMGMWYFQYGDDASVVKATSKAVLYDDLAEKTGGDECLSVAPRLFVSCVDGKPKVEMGSALCNIFEDLASVFGNLFAGDWDGLVEACGDTLEELFGDTTRFIYDTKLIEVT